MRAYTLATTPDSSERITPEIVDVFIDFVRTTRDPDVKGLVEAMEQELREHWLYERIYQGREVGAGEITSDSEVLLARALLADCPTKNPYNLTIKGKLRNLAHRHGRSRDADDDWAEAQRIVARQGLEYLMRLQPQ